MSTPFTEPGFERPPGPKRDKAPDLSEALELARQIDAICGSDTATRLVKLIAEDMAKKLAALDEGSNP